VRERSDQRPPPLAEVRQVVEREFLSDRRKRRLNDMYEQMLARYRVTVDRAPPIRPQRATAAGASAPEARSDAPPPGAVRGGGGGGRHPRGQRARTAAGFLELRESAPGAYSFLWKKPSGGEIENLHRAHHPKGCRLTTSGQQQLTPGRLSCAAR